MAKKPGSSTTAELQFHDNASCKRWIASLPLTNVRSTQQTLRQQIALARQAGLAPLELLRVLETLREPVAYVQVEMARKYTACPQPLDNTEAAQWASVATLWQETIASYLLCRDAYLRGDAALKAYGAHIVMRILRNTSYLMFEYYRVYRQPPSQLWNKICALYACAEQSGFAQTTITDVFNHQQPDSTCSAAFCQALLAQRADPFALSGRQMEFLARWIERWSGQVNLVSQPPPASSIPALAIDLAASEGPVIAAGLKPLPSLRYLDLEPLSSMLRQFIPLLKQGKTPAQLGLGEDARQPGCENLLMLLYIQWCRTHTGRSEPREGAAEKTPVCLGMHAAHFHISGRAFRAPGGDLTRQETSDIQLFGHVSERTEQMLASGRSAAIESWGLVNQSSSGFMYMVREPQAEMRLGRHHLVAMRCASDRLFCLGLAQWLCVDENNELSVGVRRLPGNAHAVAVRAANFSTPSGTKGFERGLLLAETTGASAPFTLILSGGWYQAGRLVEIHGQPKQVVKLINLLEKGTDFERCTVALV